MQSSRLTDDVFMDVSEIATFYEGENREIGQGTEGSEDVEVCQLRGQSEETAEVSSDEHSADGTRVEAEQRRAIEKVKRLERKLEALKASKAELLKEFISSRRNHAYLWRIYDWWRVKDHTFLQSEEFHSGFSQSGYRYKLMVYIYPRGIGSGVGRYVSIGWKLIGSVSCNVYLAWPFPGRVRFKVMPPVGDGKTDLPPLEGETDVDPEDFAFQRPGLPVPSDRVGEPNFFHGCVIEQFAEKEEFYKYESETGAIHMNVTVVLPLH